MILAKSRGVGAQSLEHVTLILRVVSASPTLGTEAWRLGRGRASGMGGIQGLVRTWEPSCEEGKTPGGVTDLPSSKSQSLQV